VPVLRNTEGSAGIAGVDELGTADADMVVRRIRMVFRKTGDLRFLGHLEMARVSERACRRAAIPVAFSGGYSPKPRITFALSLPAGAEAWGEWMDLELSETVSAVEILERMNRHLPEGLSILRAWKVPVEGGGLDCRVRYMTYKATFSAAIEGLGKLVQNLAERDSIPFLRLRKGKEKEVDLKRYLLSITSEAERSVTFRLALKAEDGSARPMEVLQALFGLEEESLTDVRLIRTSLTMDFDLDRALSRAGMARVWD